MIDHIALQVSDLDKARQFYTPLLAVLGYTPEFDFGVTIGYSAQPTAETFWIAPAPPENTETRELHIAFKAKDRNEVELFHAQAVSMGAEVLHGPRIFEEYHPNYFATFLRGPDGHNVEAVTHTPAD